MPPEGLGLPEKISKGTVPGIATEVGLSFVCFRHRLLATDKNSLLVSCNDVTL